MSSSEETGILPLPEWLAVSEELASSARSTVLVIGASDRGKSSLVKFLTRSVASRGVTVAVVDADLGQSALCLPGTVSLSVFRSATAVEAYRCERFSFLGSVSPAPVLRLLILETGRLAAEARKSAPVTLIDTTGLVAGGIGKVLKEGKAAAVRPDLILVIQRGNELGHVVAPQGVRVVRLEPSSLIRTRSAAARLSARKEKLDRYFRESREILLSPDQVEIRKFGKLISKGRDSLAEGMIVGLGRGQDADTSALGIVTECDSDSAVVKTPCPSPRGIRRIITGNMFVEG